LNESASPEAACRTQLGARIAEELGLHFAPERYSDLDRGVAAVAQQLGHTDAQAFAAWLCVAPWDQRLVRTLATELTVGETYFFRDHGLLRIVSDQVLPELIRLRRAQGRLELRLWSAGCCTGEEAYSLAILVREALPDLPQWRVSIMATDINPQFLDRARAGLFREWAFRGAPAQLRQRYFEREGEGSWRVAAHIRRMVRFEELNLAGKMYPSPFSGTDAIDLLFCRNVLMYFSPPRVDDVVARLRQSLAEGGWLVVSPSEACGCHFPGLVPENFDEGVLFRRPAARAWRQEMPA